MSFSQPVQLAGATIELRPGFAARPKIRHVLFDFDGTLSLIRQGWPEVMLPMFLEMLPRRPHDQTSDLEKLLLDDIMRLNGKQTIYQMIQLAERVRDRGGVPSDPLEYKHEYLRRLGVHIEKRLDQLRHSSSDQDAFLVHGARAFLSELKDRGLILYLASGTDETYVRQEADLLGLAPFFENRIYGARDDYKSFSKKMVIDRILRESAATGEQLLSFGDGYVEIQNTVEAGGLAVAVASDEANNGSGKVDAWKRERLTGVGAHAVIPDYRDGSRLLRLIFGEEQP